MRVYGNQIEPGGMELDDCRDSCECPECKSNDAVSCYWETCEGGSINTYSNVSCPDCGYFAGDDPYGNYSDEDDESVNEALWASIQADLEAEPRAENKLSVRAMVMFRNIGWSIKRRIRDVRDYANHLYRRSVYFHLPAIKVDVSEMGRDAKLKVSLLMNNINYKKAIALLYLQYECPLRCLWSFHSWRMGYLNIRTAFLFLIFSPILIPLWVTVQVGRLTLQESTRRNILAWFLRRPLIHKKLRDDGIEHRRKIAQMRDKYQSRLSWTVCT